MEEESCTIHVVSVYPKLELYLYLKTEVSLCNHFSFAIKLLSCYSPNFVYIPTVSRQPIQNKQELGIGGRRIHAGFRGSVPVRQQTRNRHYSH